MVFLQAAISSRGPAARCLESVEAGVVRLAVSETVLEEVANVLGRSEIRRRRELLTAAFITAFVERVRGMAFALDRVPERFTYERDPGDQAYLDLAIAADARYLVSRDRDLLDLQSSDSRQGQALRALIPGLTILEPVEFLHRLGVGGDEASFEPSR